MKTKIVAVLLVASAALSGCAGSGMMDQINNSVSQHQAQAQTVFKLYQDPSNIASDGTLQVVATISEIQLIEVEKANTTAQTLAGPFGTIAKLGATMLDSGKTGEVVTARQFQLKTNDGVTFVTTQPTDDEYEQAFSEGDAVNYLSTRPVTEGDNVFYIRKI